MLKFNKKTKMWHGTEDDYHEACNDNAGLCVECGYMDEENFYEPDATQDCLDCGGEDSCMGVEQALLFGNIEV